MKQMTLGLRWNRDGHEMVVTKVFKNGKIQVTETWISEDTWKECKNTFNCIVATDENGNEFAYSPEYEQYAFDEKEEGGYRWWARYYAVGADNYTVNNEMSNKEDKDMTEAMVQVVDFELNGVRYTNTRPNYYYKKQDGKQVRISKAEYEEALANSGLEKEIEEQKTKTTKKTTRKSKDIALEVNGVTLTKKQVAFLKRLPEDDFYEHGLDSALWIDVLCDTVADEFNAMSVGAMVSTLREKNLISVSKERVNGKIAKYMAFTETGKEVAKKLGLK